MEKAAGPRLAVVCPAVPRNAASGCNRAGASSFLFDLDCEADALEKGGRDMFAKGIPCLIETRAALLRPPSPLRPKKS